MTAGRTPQLRGPAWLVQAALVAQQFYLEGRSKVEIGDDLGLSRFKVARILEEARELGLVEVTIHLPARIDGGISTALHRHLGIDRTIVLAAGAAPDDVRAQLGDVAAGLLAEVISPDDVLGLSCSRSVTATTSALTALAPCDVVQLTGTLAGHDSGPGSVESVRRASEVGGGRAFPIYAPMLVPDAATAGSLCSQPAMRRTLDRLGDVSAAMVAVGGWGPDTSTVWVSATPAEREAAAAAGAVGEIGGRVFGTDGSDVATELDHRVLGVTLDQLRAVRHKIVLAHDVGRAAAVHAAARGGLIDTLVCDHRIAVRLLELPPREAP